MKRLFLFVLLLMFAFASLQAKMIASITGGPYQKKLAISIDEFETDGQKVVYKQEVYNGLTQTPSVAGQFGTGSTAGARIILELDAGIYNLWVEDAGTTSNVLFDNLMLGNLHQVYASQNMKAAGFYGSADFQSGNVTGPVLLTSVVNDDEDTAFIIADLHSLKDKESTVSVVVGDYGLPDGPGNTIAAGTSVAGETIVLRSDVGFIYLKKGQPIHFYLDDGQLANRIMGIVVVKAEDVARIISLAPAVMIGSGL